MKKNKMVMGTLLALMVWLPASQSLASDWVYSVIDGDNLWDLSEKYLDKVHRWKALQKLNAIKNPKVMQPGTLVRIPMKWIRSNPVPATLEQLHGGVSLLRADGGRLENPPPGTLLQLGDQLITAQSGGCLIRFADNSKIAVRASSRVRFDHLSAHGETGMVDSRVHLLEGSSETQVTPASGPGSRFEIQSPSAISAVRGTAFRMSADPADDASRVEVLKGRVQVSAQRKSTSLPAGFGTRVAKGQPPSKPRRLLPAPALNPLPEKIDQLNWPVTWTPVAGAVAYQAEIAQAESFDSLLWSARVAGARVPLPDLPDGSYHLRLRAIDSIGLQGHNENRRITLDAHPQPPVLLMPAEGAVLRAAAPQLRWSASADATRYRMQIATDETFNDLLLEQDQLTRLDFTPTDLIQPGRYYWRLFSINAAGELGPAGLARSWQVKPIPEKPEARIEADDKVLNISWREGIGGQTYQVQLAEDEQFKSLILDERIDQARLTLDQVKGQVRFLRVRYIEPDGYLGPWAATQRIDALPDRGWISVLSTALLGVLLL